MIVIVEGMDRCGKDTLIKNITKYMYSLDDNKSVQVLHYSNLPIKSKNKIIEMSHILYDDMFKLAEYSVNKFHLIMNRAHLGEKVYGYIYRNYEADFIYSIELKYPELMDKIILITLIDSSLNCLNREDGFSFSEGDYEKGKLECKRFSIATKKSNIKNKMFIDISDNTIESVTKKAVDFIDKT